MFSISHQWKRYKRNAKGFTLLEILIALTLFTFISISLIRMTDKTIQYKKKITRNIKDTKSSRIALQIIRKDIRNAFYRKDMNVLTYNEVLSSQDNSTDIDSHNRSQRSSQNNKITAQLKEWMELEVLPYKPFMHSSSGIGTVGIVGKNDALYITSRSYIRNHENEKSSDQNTITYYLKSCKSREDQKKKSTCLWRKFSPDIYKNIENIPTSDYKEFVLLEKVKIFELSYYDFPSNEWFSEWRTGNNRRNTLPDAIRIKIEFENKRKQIVKQELHVPLHQQFLLPIE